MTFTIKFELDDGLDRTDKELVELFTKPMQDLILREKQGFYAVSTEPKVAIEIQRPE